MFRAVPLGRALGKSFSFLVDTSSRAFRRARSKTLPFEQLDLSSVQLKHAPIALRWRSAEEPLSRGQAPRAEAVETGVSLPIDPHRLGFGSQAVSLRRRPPPHARFGMESWASIRGWGHAARSGLVVTAPRAVMESILLGLLWPTRPLSVMETIPI